MKSQAKQLKVQKKISMLLIKLLLNLGRELDRSGFLLTCPIVLDGQKKLRIWNHFKTLLQDLLAEFNLIAKCKRVSSASKHLL